MAFMGSDGSEHQSEYDRDFHEKNVYGEGGNPSTRGGGGAMGGMVGIFIALFILGPVIVAKLAGWIWGLLLKLGIVGKIITTVLMIVVGPFIVLVPMSMAQSLFKGMGSLWSLILIFGSALLAPAWYYFWHYDVVKAMGASVFSDKIKKFAMFVWFGGLGGLVISFFGGGGKEAAGVISIIVTIAGFAYYFLSTRTYAREVERTKSFKYRWIGLAVAVGLATTFVAQNEIPNAKRRQQIATIKKAEAEHAQAEFIVGTNPANADTIKQEIVGTWADIEDSTWVFTANGELTYSYETYGYENKRVCKYTISGTKLTVTIERKKQTYDIYISSDGKTLALINGKILPNWDDAGPGWGANKLTKK